MTRYTYIGKERFPLPAQQEEPIAAPVKKRKASRPKQEEKLPVEIHETLGSSAPDGADGDTN